MEGDSWSQGARFSRPLLEVGGWKATTGDEANSWRQAQGPGWAPALKIEKIAQIKTVQERNFTQIGKSTCSGSEEPEPRRPEVAEPPLPGEEEEREEP